jgi:DNA-binding GntR family transcriptional regulator
MTTKKNGAAPTAIQDQPQLPLYQLVFQTLRDEIVSGRFDDFGQLPSELSLEERFGVSRITIRRACDELERAALIERSKGRSARLVPRLPPVVSDVRQELETHKTQHQDMAPKVLHFAWITPDAVLADTLDIPLSEKVLWVTRLRSRRKRPVSHTSVFIPHRCGVGISKDMLESAQLLDVWHAMGHRIASAEQIMSAAPAAEPVASLLDLRPGEPMFCIRRLFRDAHGRPMGLLYASLRWDRFTHSMSLEENSFRSHSQSLAGRRSHAQTVGELALEV